MEIDPEKFKQLMELIFSEVKIILGDLLAHRLVIARLKQEMGLDLDSQINDARNSPVIAKEIHEECEAPLETLGQLVDSAAQDQVYLQFLQEWKPSGRVV